MNIQRNSSDMLFDKQLPVTFDPPYFKWKNYYGDLGSHADIEMGYYETDEVDSEIYKQGEFLSKGIQIFQNPTVINSYVIWDANKVMFMHKTGNLDFPSIHRFMGPAVYQVEHSKLTGMKWFLQNQEYTEYEYWTLMCRLFSDRLMMCFSGDETRYYIEHDRFKIPFPNRLNLPVHDLSDCDDENRTELAGHVVWRLADKEYMSSEEFWYYWENKGYDLKQLF